jgi:hypothetical protein
VDFFTPDPPRMLMKHTTLHPPTGPPLHNGGPFTKPPPCRPPIHRPSFVPSPWLSRFLCSPRVSPQLSVAPLLSPYLSVYAAFCGFSAVALRNSGPHLAPLCYSAGRCDRDFCNTASLDCRFCMLTSFSAGCFPMSSIRSSSTRLSYPHFSVPSVVRCSLTTCLGSRPW